jgi:hypothetical protein
MARIAAEDARELARLYYDLAVTLGQYRFDNWSSFSSAQRAELESLEWTLLTQSSDMTTRAILIAAEDMKPALKSISRATRNLTRAVRRINDVKKTINIASKAIDMGSAIFTGNIGAITKAVGAAISAAGLDEK